MRQHSDNTSVPAKGIVLDSAACVAVQWPFLSFPATIVLLTLVFFTTMLMETRPTHARPHIWKSFPLALLYHGLVRGDSMNHDVEDLKDTTVEYKAGLKAMGKSTVVRLGRSATDVTNLEIQADGKSG